MHVISSFVEQLHVQMQFLRVLSLYWPGSVVGIATRYGLDGKGIESRWGGEFFRTRLDRLCKIGTPFLSRDYSGRGVALTTHSDLT